MTLNEALRQALLDARAKGWTWQALAKATGVNQSTFYSSKDYLLGEKDFGLLKSGMNLKTVEKLCDFFGVTCTATRAPEPTDEQKDQRWPQR